MPKILIKRGTATQWTASTTALLAGELGLDTTNNIIKVGNGTTLWNSLPGLTLTATQVNELAQDALKLAFDAGTHTNISVTFDDDNNKINLSTGPDVVTTTSLGNTLNDPATGYVPISDVGNVDGVAPLDENSLIPDEYIPSTIARDSELFSGSYNDLSDKPNITLGAVQWTANHYQLSGGANTRYLAGDIVWDGGNIYLANYDNESLPTTNTLYWSLLGPGKRLNIDGRDIPNILWENILQKPSFSGTTNEVNVTSTSSEITIGLPDDVTITGNLTLSNSPTQASHAATKSYVDNTTAGLNFHAAVHAATTANLSATYSNGTSGVGATLTATSNGALIIDGHTLSETERVLVKNQAAGLQNGIYVVTAAGDGSNPWILTRATDADNSPTGEVSYGDFVFVQNGTVNAGYGYILNTTGTITLGTTSISFVQFNAGQTVIAGYGLTESSPGTIAIDTAVTATQTALSAKLDSSAFTYASITIPVYNTIAELPSAASNHGRWAHVHGEGAMYFAHGGAWYKALSETNLYVSTNAQNGSYTLATTDLDKMVEMSGGGTLTITDSSSFPVGFTCNILQTGSSQVTIAGNGFTPNATPGLKLRAQWSSATLVKRALNSWVVMGDLSA